MGYLTLALVGEWWSKFIDELLEVRGPFPLPLNEEGDASAVIVPRAVLEIGAKRDER